jgi:lipopolysaccharide/colanic/teichoic acid biosynthesis glycosyltransferase
MIGPLHPPASRNESGPYLKRLYFLMKLQTLGTLAPVLSAKEFRASLQRERALASRNGYKFCMLMFRLPIEGYDFSPLGPLVKSLARRLRTTDEVGWMEPWHIGVLLRDTPEEGGWKVVEDVVRELAPAGIRPTCDVQEYPAEKDDPRRKKHEDPRQTWFGDLYPEWKLEEPAGLELNRRNGNGDGGNGRHGNGRDGNGNGGNGHHGSGGFGNGRSGGDAGGSGSRGNGSEVVGRMHREPAPIANLPFVRPIPWSKRLLDIALSLSALIALSPLFLLMAAIIKVVSPGPVFFKQERVGYLGRRFMCWKFRSMRVKNDAQVHKDYYRRLMNSETPMTKLDQKKDPRLIPLGRFFRATGLDELPQLINVLKGDMSLVGPRPCLPYEYEAYLQWYKQRFDTLPGLTGLWQVSGKNHTTFCEMIRLDISYVRKMSVWMDAIIMMKTVPALVEQTRELAGHSTGG